MLGMKALRYHTGTFTVQCTAAALVVMTHNNSLAKILLYSVHIIHDRVHKDPVKLNEILHIHNADTLKQVLIILISLQTAVTGLI